MLKNYLKVAFRTLRRHKGYSFLNIASLSVGLACAFMIVLWVQDELSYDRFHTDGDQIYRVMQNTRFGGRLGTKPSIPKPLDGVLDEEYPEITHSVLMSWESNMVVSLGEKVFRAEGRHFGPDLFTVFTFPMLVGDPGTALEDPASIAISEAMAERYFGADWRTLDNILGTTFRIDNRLDVKLTGVFENVPRNSSLQFEFVLPIEEFNRNNQWVDDWSNNGLNLFVRLMKTLMGNRFLRRSKAWLESITMSLKQNFFYSRLKICTSVLITRMVYWSVGALIM